MALTFRYRRFLARQPVLSLGGANYRTYPLIDVTVIGPSASTMVSGLLDTGADDTVLPLSVAAQLGVDLSSAPASSASGVGVVALPLLFAEVTLRLASDTEQREWRATIAFTSAPLKRSLLGYAGFLQFFTATFRGDLEEVELEINTLYPGT